MLVSYSLYTFVQIAEQGLRLCGKISSAKPVVSIYGFKEVISAIFKWWGKTEGYEKWIKNAQGRQKDEVSEAEWKDNFARMKKGK